jgi:hypothetical protein
MRLEHGEGGVGFGLVRIDGADELAGRLWCHRRRGVASQTFRYAASYLALPGAYELDPRLPLVEGAQQTPAGREIFRAFSDAAPDRWGRRLIGRAERRRVKRHGGTARSFEEADYLLGVRDDLRQGALRFRDPDGGEFLAPPETGVPSLLDLPVPLGARRRTCSTTRGASRSRSSQAPPTTTGTGCAGRRSRSRSPAMPGFASQTTSCTSSTAAAS